MICWYVTVSSRSKGATNFEKMAAAAGNVGDDEPAVIRRDLELPKLDAMWPTLWQEFVALGGLKQSDKGAIVKLLYFARGTNLRTCQQ